MNLTYMCVTVCLCVCTYYIWIYMNTYKRINSVVVKPNPHGLRRDTCVPSLQLHILYAQGDTFKNIHSTIIIGPKSKLTYPFFPFYILDL